MKVKTHYEVLHVTINATAEQIKSAYRVLVKKYHPDVNKRKGSTERFIKIQQAYEVLRDPTARVRYNQTLIDAAIGRMVKQATKVYYGTATGTVVRTKRTDCDAHFRGSAYQNMPYEEIRMPGLDPYEND